MNIKVTETSLKTTATSGEINHEYRLYIKGIYDALKQVYCGTLYLIEQDKKVIFGLDGRQLGYTERTMKDGKIYFKSIFNQEIREGQ